VVVIGEPRQLAALRNLLASGVVVAG